MGSRSNGKTLLKNVKTIFSIKTLKTKNQNLSKKFCQKLSFWNLFWHSIQALISLFSGVGEDSCTAAEWPWNTLLALPFYLFYCICHWGSICTLQTTSHNLFPPADSIDLGTGMDTAVQFLYRDQLSISGSSFLLLTQLSLTLISSS